MGGDYGLALLGALGDGKSKPYQVTLLVHCEVIDYPTIQGRIMLLVGFEHL